MNIYPHYTDITLLHNPKIYD